MNSRAAASEPQPSQSTRIALTLLLLAIAFAGLTWANYGYALENPGGNDFIPRWVGLRYLLTQGVSPYSDEASQAIQQIIFGRPARESEDHSLFVYPLYTVVVMWPYALVGNLPLARALWMTTLELALLLIAAGSLRLAGWRPSPGLFGGLFVFIALWYHSVRPIINGNPGILVALFVLAALLAIQAERDGWAGLFLALATIKLHVVLLLLPLVAWWAFSQRRWWLVAAPPLWLLLLAGVTTLFWPDWIGQNWQQIRAYPAYTLPGTPGAIFAQWWPAGGRAPGWLLTAVMAVLLVREWRAVWGQPFNAFLWTAGATLVITALIGVQTATENYIVFFPSLVLIWSLWEKQWGSHGRRLIAATLLLLFFGLWALFLATLEAGATQHLIMFLPLPLFTLAALYTVRRMSLAAS